MTTSPSPRAAPLDRIAAAAEAVWRGSGVAVEAVPELPRALEAAEAVAREGDGILVAGSLITVGAARDRYLPVDVAARDEVVVTPDDEDDLDVEDLEEASELLADESAFASALETLLGEPPEAEDEHDDR